MIRLSVPPPWPWHTIRYTTTDPLTGTPKLHTTAALGFTARVAVETFLRNHPKAISAMAVDTSANGARS